MLDKISAVIALAAFAAFVIFMVVRVGEVDLWIFALAVLAMVGADFLSELRKGKGNNKTV